MRNHWFHNHQAEYLSTCTDINPKTVSAERDFLFGLSEAEAQASKYKKADVNNTPLKPQIKRIAPQERSVLLESFLPPAFTFYRAALTNEPAASPPAAQQAAERKPRPRAVSGAAAELDAASSTPSSRKPSFPPFNPPLIFGSITHAEIAISMTQSLQQLQDQPSPGNPDLHERKQQGSRVVIRETDITITGRADVREEIDGQILPTEELARRRRFGLEESKIKALGTYWVEIGTKGSPSTTAAESTSALHPEGKIEDPAQSGIETGKEAAEDKHIVRRRIKVE